MQDQTNNTIMEKLTLDSNQGVGIGMPGAPEAKATTEADTTAGNANRDPGQVAEVGNSAVGGAGVENPAAMQQPAGPTGPEPGPPTPPVQSPVPPMQ